MNCCLIKFLNDFLNIVVRYFNWLRCNVISLKNINVYDCIE